VPATPGQPLYYTVYPGVCQAAIRFSRSRSFQICSASADTLPWRPAERPSADEVQMKVEDTLTRIRPHIP